MHSESWQVVCVCGGGGTPCISVSNTVKTFFTVDGKNLFRRKKQ
jgi:hypothetical protein